MHRYLLLFVAFLSMSLTGLAADPPVEKSFAGKAACVQLEKANGPFLFLEDPEVKTFGNHTFLIGAVISPDKKAPRVRRWIPIAQVIMLEEFATVDDMGKMYRFNPTAEK